MGHATMTPQITVLNPEGKADDVKIRDNRTGHAEEQDRPGEDGMSGGLAECEGDERVGECRGHAAVFFQTNERQTPCSKPICRQAS